MVLGAGVVLALVTGGCADEEAAQPPEPKPETDSSAVEASAGLVVDEIAERPTATEATVYRWIPSDEREAEIQAAVTELTGDPEVEIGIEGPRFEFETGGAHSHGEPGPTTVPADPGAVPDEEEARRRTIQFLQDAGFEPVPDTVTAFPAGGFVSIEAGVALVGDDPVLRATASVTFDGHGDVIGGYGPIGKPVEDRRVELVDVDTALDRLAVNQARAGSTDPVTIVAADVMLSLREDVTADGMPTGESWLLPVYRFVDADGIEREVDAVAD